MALKHIDVDFSVPEGWQQFRTIDTHTGGEPLRVILSGYPEIRGDSILEKRSYVRDNLDHLRTALMYEPRGHADMYGCLIVAPEDEHGDFGVLFLHNEGYSTMCGHATLAVTKLAVECGWVDASPGPNVLKIDAPCGRLTAYATVESGVATNLSFDNVPSFVADLDAQVVVEGMGKVRYDLAYGGAFYAFVDADRYGIDLTEGNVRQLIDAGMRIKRAVASQRAITHPVESDLGFLYGTIFTGAAHGSADSRNVCIFAEGEVDRSPTGSGVSARTAIHFARGELQVGERMEMESILGTTFTCFAKESVNYAGIDAVIPNVSGTAYVTGNHHFVIDPGDPLKQGFILR